MKCALPLALGLILGAAAAPAFAQLATGEAGSGMGMGGVGGAPPPQAKLHTPDIAPAGLPGIGNIAPPATGPQIQKPASGDPTQELFAAINANDYGSAQDAVSRGADITAKDQFGETPLDLSIALNRNNITFLLLGTRNELASQGLSGTVGAPWTLDKTPASKPVSHKASAVLPAAASPAPRASVPAGGTGTPNPQAGFLGFGSKS
ncbi:MAG: ankyrin repeat domain-containing protein [Rhodospirillales bacterium]|nr:ankyrin repeat domain-containing protein [Rhodospirillales bacterium]